MDAQKKKIVGLAIIAAAILFAVFMFTNVASTSENPKNQENLSFIKSQNKVDLSMYSPRVDNITTPEKIEQSRQEYALSTRDIFVSEEIDSTNIEAEYESYIASDDIPKLEYEPVAGRTKKQLAPKTGAIPQSASQTQRTTTVTATAAAVPEPTVSSPQDDKAAQYSRLLAALEKEKTADAVSPSKQEVQKVVQSVSAVIHGEQTVTYNGRVKMRTTQAGQINGTDIPANTYIFGTASVNQNRIVVQVTNAVINGREVFLKASVFDASDGGQGIFIAGLDLQTNVNSEISSEASSILRQGGAGGRIAGGIVQGISQNQNQKITLSNNHKVFIQ